MANGATLPCIGYYKAIPLKLQDYSCVANLYVLKLGGCDLVLGVDWLKDLGSILWNFFRPNYEVLVWRSSCGTAGN